MSAPKFLLITLDQYGFEQASLNNDESGEPSLVSIHVFKREGNVDDETGFRKSNLFV